MKRSVCLLLAAMLLSCGVPAILFAADQPAVEAAAEIAKININTASQTELQSLPGIGKVTAERIVAYRTDSGLFKTIDDIVNVKGIGEKSFEKIRDLISVE